jgi:glyoxylase-like metal-dependent hydrolase (beta-lactamase superfamily II)
MKKGFKLGDFELTWLNGGIFELDGGTMFGVVPKVLWSKKYASSEDNYIPLTTWPILVKTGKSLTLIETGLGNKLTDKQKRIFRVKQDWEILKDLNQMGLKREDINFVILTHYDWDHAGGVVMIGENGNLTLTFPNARHILQKKEWEDVLAPNVRSINSFWTINYETLKNSNCLELVDGDTEILSGIKVFYTGGHNRGHQIVQLESKGEKALHLADLMPDHAHFNPLWVMAYDNYPMDVIAQKENWENKGVNEDAWFTFYHDPYILACKFDKDGNIIKKWPD